MKWSPSPSRAWCPRWCPSASPPLSARRDGGDERRGLARDRQGRRRRARLPRLAGACRARPRTRDTRCRSAPRELPRGPAGAVLHRGSATTRFVGEGHRKVRVRLRFRDGVHASRTRVLRLMREHHLLSPHRLDQNRGAPHDRESSHIAWTRFGEHPTCRVVIRLPTGAIPIPFEVRTDSLVTRSGAPPSRDPTRHQHVWRGTSRDAGRKAVRQASAGLLAEQLQDCADPHSLCCFTCHVAIRPGCMMV